MPSFSSISIFSSSFHKYFHDLDYQEENSLTCWIQGNLSVSTELTLRHWSPMSQHAHRNLQQGLYEIVSFKSPIFILFLKTWSLHLWPWHEPLRDTSSITFTDFRWSQLTAWGSSCSFQRSTMSWLWSSSRQHCLFSDVECLHSFIHHFYCCFNLCEFHMTWRNLSYDFLTLHGNMIVFLHNHLSESSTQMSIETNGSFRNIVVWVLHKQK